MENKNKYYESYEEKAKMRDLRLQKAEMSAEEESEKEPDRHGGPECAHAQHVHTVKTRIAKTSEAVSHDQSSSSLMRRGCKISTALALGTPPMWSPGRSPAINMDLM